MSIMGRTTQGLYPQDEGSQGAVCMINIADIALDTVWRAIKVVGAKGIKPLAKVSTTGIKSMTSNMTSSNKDLVSLAKNGEKLDSFTVDKKDLSMFRNAFKKYGIEFVEVKSNGSVEMFFKTKDYNRVKRAVESIIKDLSNKKEKYSEIVNYQDVKSLNDTIERVEDVKNQVDLQSLISEGKELNSIDIGETELAPLQKLCKKYSVEIAVVEAADGSYRVFFKAQDYTRLEAALKDIGVELDKELGKTPKDIQIVYAEQNIEMKDRPLLSNDSHIQRTGEERKKLPMKEQIDKAKVKAVKINKEQQKQREKSQNRNRNKPGRAKGGAR